MSQSFTLSDLIAPKGQAQTTSDSFSLADLSKQQHSGVKTFWDQAMSTAASAGDFIGGFLDVPVQVMLNAGNDLGGSAYALMHPEARLTSKQILQNSMQRSAQQDKVSNLGSKLYEHLTGEKPKENAVGDAMSMIGDVIGKAATKLEKETGGKVPAEAFEQLTNALILKIPHLTKMGATLAARKIFAKRMSSAEQAEIDQAFDEANGGGGGPSGDVIRKPIPTNEELRDLKRETDNHRNAAKKANDLMKRGASNAEVERAIKRDKTGLLKDYLGAIRERRAAAAESFDRDFGTRQGEVLPPEDGRLPGGPDNGAETGDGNAPTPRLGGDGGPKNGGTGGNATPENGAPNGPENNPRALAAPPFLLENKAKGKPVPENKQPEAGGPTLGDLHTNADYTTKVLQRLPQNKARLSRSQIEQELRRQDVSKAEKDTLQGVLDSLPKGDKTISAEDLWHQFQSAVVDHRLVSSESNQWADYGLENINRSAWGVDSEGNPIRKATTTIWNPRTELGKSKHFKDDNYFAHTRSFIEDGVRHVVELQSDFVQNAKELSEADKKRLQHSVNLYTYEVDAANKALKEAEELIGQGWDDEEAIRKTAERYGIEFNEHENPWHTVHSIIEQGGLRIAELENKLNVKPIPAEIKPIVKNWHRRLIREEIGRAGGKPVRFATAGTMANVEGWPMADSFEPTEGHDPDYQGFKQHSGTGVILNHTGRFRIDQHGTLFRESQMLDGNGGPVGDMRWRENAYRTEATDRVRKLAHRGKLPYEPEHQSIYDRYKKDVEPYLRQLGAKDYTDEHGHTWLEVPPDAPGRPKGPVQMYGRADPKVLLGIAATLGGAATLAYLNQQDKLEAAIAGGAAGLALALAPKYIRFVTDDWKKALRTTATVAGVTAGLTLLDKKHPVEGALIGLAWGASKLLPKARIPMIGNMSIDDLINLRNGAVQAQGRKISNTVRVLQLAVPDPKRRAELASLIESGQWKDLSGNDLKAATIFRSFMDSYGAAAKDAGVLHDLIENYVTHVVEREGLPDSKAQEVLKALFADARTTGGAGSKPGFALHRKYPTFAALQQALEGSGLKVKTMDIAEIAGIYGRAMSRAIENKTLVNNLMGARENADPVASPLIMDARRAPPDYKVIDSPHLRGYAVHPDLEPALRATLERYTPSAPTHALISLAMAQKRLATSLSLFHAQNLINAYMGARGFGVLSIKSGIDAALKAYREGGEGDNVDLLLRNGLRVDMGRPEEYDAHAMEKIGNLLDGFAQKAFGPKFGMFGKGLGKLERAQVETFDRVTWDYLHSGMKLAVGLRELERAIAKNPKMRPEKAARQVSSYVNDTFGGLDWYRVASETQSQWGRKMAMALLSPRGRAKLQVLMFAPDWTISTFRAMYKALPGSDKNPLTTRLHQKYVIRSALIYATLLNGLNMVTAGQPIWDNKNPLELQYRDGTTQQIAKHAMEGPQWLRDPGKTARDKLGPAFGELVNQLADQQYPGGPKIKNRVEHAIKAAAGMAVPLSLETALEADSPGEVLKRTVESSLGVSTHGKTTSQKMREKLRKRMNPSTNRFIPKEDRE